LEVYNIQNKTRTHIYRISLRFDYDLENNLKNLNSVLTNALVYATMTSSEGERGNALGRERLQKFLISNSKFLKK